VNIKSLESFAANAVVDPDALVTAGLIKKRDRVRVKLLGEGDVAHGLTVRVHAVSEAAKTKIEAKGGRVELIQEKAAAS
jgi:large subunit ribosomal protein L15